MRYNLGCMDKYPIEAACSVIENCPLYKVTFNNFIDPIKLEAAVLKALDSYPLFKTQVRFDHEYYLRTNNKPLVILECKEEDRPKTFGKNTNGYPFRICYYQKEMCFEWQHGITDGSGAIDFLKQILLSYFDCDTDNRSNNFLVAPGLEPFFDKKEKGKNFEEDPLGFRNKDFKPERKGYTTNCHKIVCDTEEILRVTHLCKTSITTCIAILFSQALRLHLPQDIKNRNVAVNIDMDLRKTLNYETMHNCIEIKRLTYTDEYDKMSFTSIGKIYKEKLDNARVPENIVRILTDRVKTFRWVHCLPGRPLLRLCYKIGGPIFKHSDSNLTITYPGRLDLPEDIMKKIDNLELKVWHDIGECMIAAVDFKGKFTLQITENYIEKGIVEDFIKLAKKVGIHFKNLGCSEFTQSHFVEG